jgi:peptidoglycan/LPS O-acetylase OafA/YrhL
MCLLAEQIIFFQEERLIMTTESAAVTASGSGKFDGIQVMRGLAALFVFVAHIPFSNPTGMFGVDIFFCISGFLMVYTTRKNSKHFMLKRIIRLVPYYWLVTFAVFLVGIVIPSAFEYKTVNPSPVNFVQSLFFFPFAEKGLSGPLLGVGGTLNWEMLFYFLFWLSCKISLKYRAVICSAFLLLLVILGSIVDLPLPFSFWTNNILLEFILGMSAYYIIEYIRNATQRNATQRNATQRNATQIILIIVSLIMLAIMVAFSLPTSTVSPNISRVIYFGLPAFVLFLTFFFFSDGIKIPKVFVTTGDISYSIYLVHFLVIAAFRIFIAPIADFSLTNLFFAFCCLAVTLAVAYVGYYVIEVKLTGVLKALLLKNKT